MTNLEYHAPDVISEGELPENFFIPALSNESNSPIEILDRAHQHLFHVFSALNLLYQGYNLAPKMLDLDNKSLKSMGLNLTFVRNDNRGYEDHWPRFKIYPEPFIQLFEKVGNEMTENFPRITFLMGLPGSGKTTLFNSMEDPLAGRIGMIDWAESSSAVYISEFRARSFFQYNEVRLYKILTAFEDLGDRQVMCLGYLPQLFISTLAYMGLDPDIPLHKNYIENILRAFKALTPNFSYIFLNVSEEERYRRILNDSGSISRRIRPLLVEESLAKIYDMAIEILGMKVFTNEDWDELSSNTDKLAQSFS